MRTIQKSLRGRKRQKAFRRRMTQQKQTQPASIPFQQGMHYGDWQAMNRKQAGQMQPAAPPGPVPFQQGMHYGDWLRMSQQPQNQPSAAQLPAQYQELMQMQPETQRDWLDDAILNSDRMKLAYVPREIQQRLMSGYARRGREEYLNSPQGKMRQALHERNMRIIQDLPTDYSRGKSANDIAGEAIQRDAMTGDLDAAASLQGRLTAQGRPYPAATPQPSLYGDTVATNQGYVKQPPAGSAELLRQRLALLKGERPDLGKTDESLAEGANIDPSVIGKYAPTGMRGGTIGQLGTRVYQGRETDAPRLTGSLVQTDANGNVVGPIGREPGSPYAAQHEAQIQRRIEQRRAMREKIRQRAAIKRQMRGLSPISNSKPAGEVGQKQYVVATGPSDVNARERADTQRELIDSLDPNGPNANMGAISFGITFDPETARITQSATDMQTMLMERQATDPMTEDDLRDLRDFITKHYNSDPAFAKEMNSGKPVLKALTNAPADANLTDIIRSAISAQALRENKRSARMRNTIQGGIIGAGGGAGAAAAGAAAGAAGSIVKDWLRRHGWNP